MRFSIYVIDRTLKDNNGASIVLWHHGHALEELGHTVQLLSLYQEPMGDEDFIIYQSEWADKLRPKLDSIKAKRICWLGHFIDKDGMPKLEDINADYYITQWKGDIVEYAKEKVKKDIYYLPHGYCRKCRLKKPSPIQAPRTVFIGARYNERKFDFLYNAQVTMITCPHEEAKNYYFSAEVCPNIHGDFQKNKVTDYMPVGGTMINDRAFSIISAGGFCVSDNPQITGEFFEGNVPSTDNINEFKRLINYYLENKEERTYLSNLAKQRMKPYNYTNYYINFLKCV